MHLAGHSMRCALFCVQGTKPTSGAEDASGATLEQYLANRGQSECDQLSITPDLTTLMRVPSGMRVEPHSQSVRVGLRSRVANGTSEAPVLVTQSDMVMARTASAADDEPCWRSSQAINFSSEKPGGGVRHAVRQKMKQAILPVNVSTTDHRLPGHRTLKAMGLKYCSSDCVSGVDIRILKNVWISPQDITTSAATAATAGGGDVAPYEPCGLLQPSAQWNWASGPRAHAIEWNKCLETQLQQDSSCAFSGRASDVRMGR